MTRTFIHLIFSVSINGLNYGGKVSLVEGRDAVTRREFLTELRIPRHEATGGHRANVNHWLPERPVRTFMQSLLTPKNDKGVRSNITLGLPYPDAE